MNRPLMSRYEMFSSFFLVRYQAKEIVILDDTALFWRLLPGKIKCFNGVRCNGGKNLRKDFLSWFVQTFSELRNSDFS